VSWYAENLLGSLPGVLASGKWFTSAGSGRIAYVPREDVARACAGALASRSGTRERLNITEGLRAAGIPAAYVPLIVATDASIRGGHFDVPTDAVKRLTGTDAQSVESYLRANRAIVSGAATK